MDFTGPKLSQKWFGISIFSYFNNFVSSTYDQILVLYALKNMTIFISSQKNSVKSGPTCTGFSVVNFYFKIRSSFTQVFKIDSFIQIINTMFKTKKT